MKKKCVIIAVAMFVAAAATLFALRWAGDSPLPKPPAPSVNVPPPGAGGNGQGQGDRVPFGTVAGLAVGGTVVYEDGLRVRLDKIDDSRCPDGVQCIWAGELAPILTLTGGLFGDESRELRLGTVSMRKSALGGYSFALNDATDSSVGVIVSRATGSPDTSHDDVIRVSNPTHNQVVSSPLAISGTARGTWYFEATFPVKLLDANGEEIAAHYAQAQGEWMTTEFVPFLSTLVFPTPKTATGTLVLAKDNPSGLPQNDDEIRILVRFSGDGEAPPSSAGSCRKTGCSGQVCADEDVITTCDFRPEYACYRAATCERQADGKCGWTRTPELARCLENPPTE